MATIKKYFKKYSGGKEGQMSGLAIVFLGIGILSLIACVIFSGFVTKTSSYSEWGANGLSPFWFALGLGCLIQGIFLFIVIGAGAEIIRLLKKQNGLNFGGKISEASPVYNFQCSECKKEIKKVLIPEEIGDSLPKECPHCRVKFAIDTEDNL